MSAHSPTTLENPTVLYLGMADDITSVLAILPNTTTLYAISLFDSAFSLDRTIEGQKHDIRNCLINGHNGDSHHVKVHQEYNPAHPVTVFKYSYTITSDSTIGDVWRLVATSVNDTSRSLTLVYYFNRNFESAWPTEVANIDHVMMQGSYYWNGIMKDGPKQTWMDMMTTRTNYVFMVYALSFNHRHLPIHFELANNDLSISALKVTGKRSLRSKHWFEEFVPLNKRVQFRSMYL